MQENSLQRIGIFYDGSFLQHVSDFYHNRHPRRARLNLGGLQQFIRSECSSMQGADLEQCRIVEAHYFRGRFAARDAIAREAVTGERYWDDVLMYLDIRPHYLPLKGGNGERISEKGIDVLFAVETLDRAMRGLYDVVVLVACDGDYAPLAKRLQLRGIPVLLIGWDLGEGTESRSSRGTRTSRRLMNEATRAVLMNRLIDDPANEGVGEIDDLFFSRRSPSPAADGASDGAARSEANGHAHAAPGASVGEANGIDRPEADEDDRDEGVGVRDEHHEGDDAGDMHGRDGDDLNPYDDDDEHDDDDDDDAYADDGMRHPEEHELRTPSLMSDVGRIFRLKADYGFIQSDALSENVFFHRSAVADGRFADLEPEDEVRFLYERTHKGLVARSVSWVHDVIRASRSNAYAQRPAHQQLPAARSWQQDDDRSGYPL